MFEEGDINQIWNREKLRGALNDFRQNMLLLHEYAQDFKQQYSACIAGGMEEVSVVVLAVRWITSLDDIYQLFKENFRLRLVRGDTEAYPPTIDAALQMVTQWHITATKEDARSAAGGRKYQKQDKEREERMAAWRNSPTGKEAISKYR